MAQPTKAEYEARLALHEEKFHAAERLHKQYADRTEQTAARVGSQMQMQAEQMQAERQQCADRAGSQMQAEREEGTKRLQIVDEGSTNRLQIVDEGFTKRQDRLVEATNRQCTEQLTVVKDLVQEYAVTIAWRCMRTHSVVVGSVRAKGTRSMSKPSLPHLQMVVQLSEREFNLSMGNLHD